MTQISLVINIPMIVFISSTLLIIGVCLFFIGYFIGKQRAIGVYNSTINRPNSFLKNSTEDKPNTRINIDASRVVTEIKTDGMERKYDKLGEVKQSSDNIDVSVNKLKNLKR